MRAIPRKVKHPDKTFIGRIGIGFDFVGCFFGTDGLSVVKKIIEQFIARAIRLYEQEPEEASPQPGLDHTCSGGSDGLRADCGRPPAAGGPTHNDHN